MNIQKVEIILRALQLGSLAKAAKEYLYTPSAISHILDAVEEEIGTKIIKRTYKGIEIEDGCEEIIEELKQLVNKEKHIYKLVSDRKKGKETINIATYSSISKYILPRIIKGFKEKFPYIDINIIVEDKLKEIYDSGYADILFGEKYEKSDSLWEELIKDPYVAVLPAEQNTEKGEILREELYNKTFIMIIGNTVSSYMEKEKMHDVIHINSHDDSSVLQMVKEGMGAAIVPSLSVKNESGVILRKLNPDLSRVLGIIYRKNDFKKKKHIKNFVEYIREFKLK